MHRLSLRRMPWVVLRGTLMVTIGISLLSVPLTMWQTLRSDSLTWDGDLDFSTGLPHRLANPAPGSSFYFDGSVEVTIDDPTTWLSFLSIVPTLLVIVAAGYVAWVLLAVMFNIEDGRAFSGAVPRLVSTLAPVIALCAVAVVLLNAYANQEIMRAALGPPGNGIPPGDLFRPNILLMVGWLVVALVVGLIARIFVEGRRLADDTEGLV